MKIPPPKKGASSRVSSLLKFVQHGIMSLLMISSFGSSQKKSHAWLGSSTFCALFSRHLVAIGSTLDGRAFAFSGNSLVRDGEKRSRLLWFAAAHSRTSQQISFDLSQKTFFPLFHFFFAPPATKPEAGVRPPPDIRS